MKRQYQPFYFAPARRIEAHFQHGLSRVKFRYQDCLRIIRFWRRTMDLDISLLESSGELFRTRFDQIERD
jgi:hypothetical protein